MIELTGITWNHTRGYLPMVATAQRFSELHPEISITWQKRSLQQFADAPLADLAARFDLMVIDHPSIGEAAHHSLLLPLDEYLPAEYLAEQAMNSVGGSHGSYHYEGHQYALATDAATPIAGWRPDLLARAEAELGENVRLDTMHFWQPAQLHDRRITYRLGHRTENATASVRPLCRFPH